MDMKTAIQPHREREVGTLSYPLAIESLVFTLCERVARDWPHRSDHGPPPDTPVVAMDFSFCER